ncbi:MAG: PAS domain S-box protein [Fibrobacterota bacterium]
MEAAHYKRISEHIPLSYIYGYVVPSGQHLTDIVLIDSSAEFRRITSIDISLENMRFTDPEETVGERIEPWFELICYLYYEKTLNFMQFFPTLNKTVTGLIRWFSSEYFLLSVTQLYDGYFFPSPEKENMQRLLLAGSARDDMLWDWDIRKNSLCVSHRWWSWLGYESKSIPTTYGDFCAHIHPEDFPRVKHALSDYFSEKTPEYSVRFRIRKKDGTYLSTAAQGTAARDREGRPLRFCGSLSSLNDPVTESDVFLKIHQAVENSRLSVVITDADGLIEYVNPYFSELTGYSLSEIQGKTPRILKSSHTPGREYTKMWNILTSGKTWRGYFYNVKKNGDPYWEYATISPICKDGMIIGYCGVKESVTREKQVEQVLQQKERRLRRYIEEAPYGITFMDPSGTLLQVNREFMNCLGYSREELVGRSFYSLIPSETEETGLSEPGDVEDGIIPFKASNGSLVWFEMHTADIIQNQRMSFYKDMTDKKIAEERLIEARRTAEKTNELKTQFMENVTHEIRTPLSGIQGFSRLLQKTDMTRRQNTYLENIIQSADILSHVVGDILNFSKLDGPLEEGLEKIDIFAFSEELANIFEKRTGNELSLIINMSYELPRYLYIYPLSVRHVMINLLDNAFKFTMGGEVQLSIYMKEKTRDRHGIFVFSVKDTGRGIENADHYSVTKPFIQEEANKTRRQGGLGLGLSIAEKLLGKMGSRLVITSRKGEGSIFSFELSCTYFQREISQDHPFSTACIIGNTGKETHILRRLLSQFSLHISVVKSLQDILECIGADSYDLIFVDWESIRSLKTNDIEKIGGCIAKTQTGTVVILGKSKNLTEESTHMIPHDSIILKPVTPGKIEQIITRGVFGSTQS